MLPNKIIEIYIYVASILNIIYKLITKRILSKVLLVFKSKIQDTNKNYSYIQSNQLKQFILNS